MIDTIFSIIGKLLLLYMMSGFIITFYDMCADVLFDGRK